MKREEIGRFIRAGGGSGGFLGVQAELSGIEDAELFWGLYPIAVGSQTNGPALTAAWLLIGLEPRCPVNCEEALRLMLPDWNPSIEEVPVYLVTQFGKQQLNRVLGELWEKVSSGDQHVIGTIQYWIGFPVSELLGGYADMCRREREAYEEEHLKSQTDEG